MVRILLIILLLAPSVLSPLLAQTVISGQVTDATSGEPLPYVTISGNNVKLGTVTDFDGHFIIKTPLKVDSLVASYIGYDKVKKAVKFGKTQVINFSLSESSASLNEIVVRPGGVNPAEVIMKRARKKKKEHDPDKINFFEYEGYNKVQLAVDNVTEKFKKRKIFDAMAPLFDTMSAFSDSSTKKVLPVFVSETISDYYYRKLPRRTKEVIHATKILGVGVGDESYVSQLLGSTFQQYNFYENNLYILDKDFISPLSLQANSYYFFALIDSIEIDGKPCYQIKVDPKNPKDLVFSGMIWIESQSYAIKRLSLEVTNEANLNFIEKLKIQQEYEEVEPTYWLPNKTRVLIDIAELTNNTVGMIGVYYNSTKNTKINKARELPFYEDNITVEENSFEQSEQYWDTARHEKITEEDKKVYAMVDSLKNQPLVKTYIDFVELAIDGHIPKGKLDLGPWYFLLGYNKLEGVRTRIGFRTTPEFHKDIQLRAYGAYGFGDKRFKYGVFSEFVLDRKKWFKVGAYVKNDVELIGVTDDNNNESAIYNAFALIGTDQINRSFTKRIWAEKELIKGYTQTINLTQKSFVFEQVGDFNFGYNQNLIDESGGIKSDYNITSINLKGRLSHKEQFIVRRTNRYGLGSLKAPVLRIDYTHSFDNILGGEFKFDQLGLHVWQFNSLGNLGNFIYNLKAFKTFGRAPYPSLFVLQGNESFFSNNQTYNLMDFFEFAADQYLSADYEHQFNGLIMNRVPLLKQLKWRSFVNAKAVYGTISEANRRLMPLQNESYTNPSFFSNGKPYIETGYGIENIFRFIRVDFIHRLTYLGDNHPNARPFGVKLNAVLRF